MRVAVLAGILITCFGATALAAEPDWLGDLFGAGHVVQHRHRAAAKPGAAKSAAAKTVAPVPAKPPPKPSPVADSPVPPLPLPRPPQAPPEATNGPPPAPAQAAQPVEGPTPAAPSPAAEGESPSAHPPRIYQTACPAVMSGLVAAKPLPPIDAGQCREQSPLAVTQLAVNGRMVPLSSPATINCEMASDLPGWVAEVDDFAETTLESRIAAVMVGGSYECRPRNTPDKSDTNISEHGRADAVDVVGFTLANGQKLTVGDDYGSADVPTSRFMHFAHDAACTRFTTVLGPDANSLHHDHFHLDLGCHGQSCTFRLCE